MITTKHIWNKHLTCPQIWDKVRRWGSGCTYMQDWYRRCVQIYTILQKDHIQPGVMLSISIKKAASQSMWSVGWFWESTCRTKMISALLIYLLKSWWFNLKLTSFQLTNRFVCLIRTLVCFLFVKLQNVTCSSMICFYWVCWGGGKGKTVLLHRRYLYFWMFLRILKYTCTIFNNILILFKLFV